MALVSDLAWYFAAWGHLNSKNVLMWTAQHPEGRVTRPPYFCTHHGNTLTNIAPGMKRCLTMQRKSESKL